MKREKTKHRGVFQRESEVKIFKGRPEVCFDICYKFDGRLVWEKCGWESEGYSSKMADTIRSERIRNIRHGDDMPKDKKSPLFKDLMKKYLEWSKENKKSYVNDESRYRNYLADRFDKKRLNEISPMDLERLKTALKKKGLQPATVKHALVLFRQAINKALMWNMFKGENIIKKIDIPKLNNARQRFLSYQEAEALLAELKKISDTVHDMALMSLHCGLRIGEICNLKNQNIDFENSMIHIVDTKNKESRCAYMTAQVKQMLQARYKENERNNYIFRDRWHGSKINELSKTFCRAVDTIGFNSGVTDTRQRISFHSLRHTFCSWLTLQGESMVTLRDLMGHKSLAMVSRYSHLSSDSKKSAVQRLEESFNVKKAREGGI